MRHKTRSALRRGAAPVLILLALLAFPFAAKPARAQSSADFKNWGFEAMGRTESDFALPQRLLYADAVKPGSPPAANRPAFMWGCGVELSALNAAAKLDSATWAPRLRRYVSGLDSYWRSEAGVGGYDVLPSNATLDRYYDDNEWVAIALCDTYELTRDKAALDRAEATFRFILHGEDDKLGGGIRWRENGAETKNTCSNGPAVVAALRLYQITRKPDYLAAAKRIYRWTNAHLQDADGLYFDNCDLNGKIEKTKWSYNTALMIRANCQFYALTKEKTYLAEARRLAEAAEKRWIAPETGAIMQGASFAHLLSESFLIVGRQTGDPRWRKFAARALTYVHDHVRDENGYYGDHWDRPAASPLREAKLIQQASAARAFLVFAGCL